MFDKFTEAARKAFNRAHEEAQQVGSHLVGTEHLLLALLEETEGSAPRVFRQLKLDPELVRREIVRIVTPPTAPETRLGQIPYSPRIKRAVELAGEAAVQLRQDSVGTEHLLVGLLEEYEGIASQALRNLGLEIGDVRRRAAEAIGQDPTRPLALRPPPPDLSRWAQTYQPLTDRPSVQDTIEAHLREGRSVALVGPKLVGKTSLVLALCRAKSGGFSYEALDCRLLDEFLLREAHEVCRPGSVCFVAQAELLTASRTVLAGILEHRRQGGERLIVEFREGGLEAFSARYPLLAKELVRVEVKAPDRGECHDLLESARTRLLKLRDLEISQDVLEEADRLARDRWRLMVPPWATIIALWKAESIHRETSARGDLEQLERDLRSPDRSPEEIEALKRHLDGLRSIGGAGLTIESVRRAIGELSGQGTIPG